MDLCPESLWADLCRDDASSTFYQTPAWHRIAARHYHAESVPMLFRFGGVSACLPLLKTRRWGRDHFFCPFGTYSALVCPEKLGDADLDSVSAGLKGLKLHLISSPFTQNSVSVGKRLISKTQVIDLTSLDPENPQCDWERDARRRVRHAMHEGIQIREAGTQADWDRYHELYRASLNRWGDKATVEYPKALFEDIRRSLENSSSMRLWVAEQKGETGVAMLVFYHNRHVVAWHAGTEKRFFPLGAMQLLFFTLIEDARRRGFSVFDFAGSGGLAGVEAFKRQFGAQTLEYESSLNRPGFLGFLAGLRDAWIKR